MKPGDLVKISCWFDFCLTVEPTLFVPTTEVVMGTLAVVIAVISSSKMMMPRGLSYYFKVYVLTDCGEFGWAPASFFEIVAP